jgi:hypothetical protein
MTTHQLRTFLAVTQWQRSLAPRRPYRMVELMHVHRTDAATIALALNMNGWTPDKVRTTRQNRRQLTTWWIPPNGKPAARRRRGRPSFADLFAPT